MASLPVQAFSILREQLTRAVKREADPIIQAEVKRRKDESKVAGQLLIAEYRRCHFKIAGLKIKRAKLALNTLMGGRAKRRPTFHLMYHRRIRAEYFGFDAKVVDGVTHKAVGALFTLKQFHKRFRMSSKTWERIYADIIDPIKGNPDFNKGPDATNRQGATACQKLCSCIRQLAYGNSADCAEEYTGVAENQGRLLLLSFCTWLDVVYGPEYLGAWTQEAIQKEIDSNAKRGFSGMLGSIDCTH